MSHNIGEGGEYSSHPGINKMLGNIVGELRLFTEEQATQIKELTAIGKALSAEQDPQVILEMILTQARRFTGADGGTLYLLSDDKRELVFHVMHNDTLNTYMGGTSGKPVTLPNVNLFHDDESRNTSNVSAYVANTGEVVNIPDVYEADGFSFEGTRLFDASLSYRSKSMLVVSMRDHEDEIIGVLQLINAKNRITNKTVEFSPDTVDMTTSLASQAAVVITQQRLIRELKGLFESFVKAIATAVDEKSRYTGGHIQRVTELTMMIAEKINDTSEGPFADVSFSGDELDELRIAAWMHDTGKITTPECIVDKSTKLEKMFDRIELVKTRWQVARLTQRLQAEEQKLELVSKNADKDRFEEIDKKCREKIELLDKYLEFIEDTNRGGEFMVDEKLEELNRIAEVTWNLNGGDETLLLEDEVYNLGIRKGTLTDEERELMNNHVSVTIRILNELPWPRKLSNVSAIAGAHHEKLDGSGYPHGLKGEEISLQAKIMAVADIFEALSAKDRPYKKPMQLSQAVKILGFMAKDLHIDQDVVDLFIESDLHLEYAREHLDKSQIDIEIG